jgi:1-acyl-sn-glycerol-3-phosphate acyltransferase
MNKFRVAEREGWISMFRTLLCWVVFVLTTVVLGTTAIFLSLFDSSGNISHRVARLWGKVQLRITGTRVRVQGLENIDPQKSYILVSNHQSTFDIFSLLGYLPLQFRWTAKAELFRIPFMGWAMTRTGYISIDRDSPKKAYRSMLRAAEVVRKGTSVIIFPEGTRSPDGKLQPFKKGAFLIALKSQAAILPITIQGTSQIMRKGDWRTFPGRVQIQIDPPMDTAGSPPVKEEELSQKVRAVFLKNLAPP